MTPRIRLDLEGMSCASCVARTERAVLALPGVISASANFSTGVLDISPGDGFSLPQAVAALRDAGYPPRVSKLVLSVDGMTCAACTGRVERILTAQPGVAKASANLALRRAEVEILTPISATALADSLTAAGYPSQPQEFATAHDPKAEEAALRRKLFLAAALTVPVLVTEMGGHIFPAFHHWLHGLIGQQALWWGQMLLTLAVLAGPGRDFFTKGLRSLWRASPDMNALVAVGAGAAFLFSALVTLWPGIVPPASRAVWFEAAAVIVTLILLGRVLEARARGQAGDAIARLVRLAPQTARLIGAEGGISEVRIDSLRPGDRLQIRPGERFALDGRVVEGTSQADESMLTGEPLPLAKSSGDAVTGGTVNGTGGLVVEVTATGADTVLARIIAMVEAAQGGKLPVQALVDRITLVFVPVVMGIAALTLVAWLIAGQGIGPALIAAVSVLIIACPCAMGLATPVSILVGTGRAAELGVLFRRGEALQRLSAISRVGFDKTGTLTMGHPVVTAVHCDGMDEAEAIRLAAAVEAHSEHPLAAAVLAKAADMAITPPKARDFAAIPGQGARAVLEGTEVLVGSEALFARISPELAAAAQTARQIGRGVLFVGHPDAARAAIIVADPLRPSAKAAIARLHKMGIATAMISGDAAATAQAVAAELGIDQVRAGVLPEGKAAAMAELAPLAFVGDGINDAPALAAAEVGIAMGTGTDVAIEAGDVVLMRSDPAAVADAIGLSRAVMRNIRQNLFWAFAYNAALIPVAAGVLFPFGGPGLSPMLGAGAMAMSSVLVITNALRLRRWRRQPSST